MAARNRAAQSVVDRRGRKRKPGQDENPQRHQPNQSSRCFWRGPAQTSGVSMLNSLVLKTKYCQRFH
jgi:hypothetical protein